MGRTMGVYDSELIDEKIRMAREMGASGSDLTIKKFKELMEQSAKVEDPEKSWPSKAELKEAGREDDTKKIHELKLHDKWWLDGFEVLRVPGGWIYDRKNAAVFVPYNDEGSKTIKL